MNRIRRIFAPLAIIAGAIVATAALSACGLDPDDAQRTPTANLAAAVQLTIQPTPTPTATQYVITPLPTPQPTNAIFGSIIGTDYTPEPLHTALPTSIAERPCRVTVSAAQVTLYNTPDTASAAVGSAFEREKLVVDQITNDSTGVQWAHTGVGWLPLQLNGTTTAALDTLRACHILTGETPNTTLMGLHVLNDTSADSVLNFVERMLNAGHPLGTVKGLNGAETLLNEIEQLSPQTVTIFRSLDTVDRNDCPRDIFELPDPVATAQRWYPYLKTIWDGVNADYYEYMNECPAPLSWISDFSIEMMRQANADGYCLLLFSFPGGNPDMSAFNELLPAYQYALDNPCASGRTHGISLHTYSTEDDKLASESDKWLAMRHRIIYERLQLMLPAAADLPVYITEYGIGGGTIMPACETIIRDALQYTYQVEEDPYVKGINLWSVGTGAQWYDITPCLPALGDALIAYYGG